MVKIKLNVDKTHMMILGTKQRLNKYDKSDSVISIQFDGTAIDRVYSTKCLGVIIDDKLLWHDHVDYVCKKVCAAIAVFKRAKPYIDLATSKIIYNCIIQSKIDYCCEVWGLRLLTQTSQVTKLQKRAVRIILETNYFTPSIQLFNRLDMLSYEKRVMYFRCIFVYKCLNNLSSDFFQNKFQYISEVHNLNTRSAANQNLSIPKCKTDYLKHSFIYSAIKVFNSIPVTIKSLPTISAYKKALKSYLMSTL